MKQLSSLYDRRRGSGRDRIALDSNQTREHARTREFIPPFGAATQPKSPALRFAIGRSPRPNLIQHLPRQRAENYTTAVVTLRTANDSITRVTPLMIMLTPTRIPIAQKELNGHCM